MDFNERIVDFNEWRNILTSDNRYLYTGIHIDSSILGDHKFVLISIRDQPILGLPIITKKMLGLDTLYAHITGLPYLGFTVFQDKVFRDIDYFMRIAKFISSKSIVSRYKLVFIKNPLYFIDPRGFYWNNWFMRVEFTYISYPDRIDLNRMRKSRVREYKKAVKEKYVVDTMDFKSFIKYYLELAREKGFYRRAGLELINRLIASNSQNLLVYVAKNDKGIGAGESFLIDERLNTCYRLFPFTTSYGRRTGAATYLLYHVLRDKLSGFPYVILLGGQDPNIARFVQDFSSELKTYFSLLFTPSSLLRKILTPFFIRKGFSKYGA